MNRNYLMGLPSLMLAALYVIEGAGTTGSDGKTEAERAAADQKHIETHDGSTRVITDEEKLEEADRLEQQRLIAESNGGDGITDSLFPEEEAYEGPTYRHKGISRFHCGDNGKFKFINFEFTPKSAAENEEFLREAALLEPMDRNAIVIINKAALAASETRLQDRRLTAEEQRDQFVRGALPASAILTAKDRQAIADANRTAPIGAGGMKIPPQGSPKPFSPLAPKA